MRLPELIDIPTLQNLADANHLATGMPVAIVDAADGAVIVTSGSQEICSHFHRVDERSAARCRQSDDYVKSLLPDATPCEYQCMNGLHEIAMPICVGGEHVATLFAGQFFRESEAPSRDYFIDQARQFGFDEKTYLAALDRVPVFGQPALRKAVEYNTALARFISEVAKSALRRVRAEAHAASVSAGSARRERQASVSQGL